MPFLSANSKKLYYLLRTADSSCNTPFTFLFVHGLGSSSSFYAPVIPTLVKSGFSCLAFDTYGSGLSKYTDQKQSIQTIASDAEALLNALQIPAEKVIAVGHSMGGLVVGHLAARKNLLGAVLLGPVSPGPMVASVFAQRIRTVASEGMESMADSIPTAATGTRSSPTHHAFIRALLLAQDPQGYISLCEAISLAVSPNYSRIHCRALFVAGEDDKTAPLEGVQREMHRWDQSTTTVQLKTIQGVGHWHCIEAAEDMSSLLLEFARENSKT